MGSKRCCRTNVQVYTGTRIQRIGWYAGRPHACYINELKNYNIKKITVEFEPEPCPKWKVLSEILRVEIPADIRRSVAHNPNALNDPIKVLILCHDSRTCYQLNQYLCQGPERFLLFTAMKNDVPISKISPAYRTVQPAAAATSIEIQDGDRFTKVVKNYKNWLF